MRLTHRTYVFVLPGGIDGAAAVRVQGSDVNRLTLACSVLSMLDLLNVLDVWLSLFCLRQRFNVPLLHLILCLWDFL